MYKWKILKKAVGVPVGMSAVLCYDKKRIVKKSKSLPSKEELITYDKKRNLHWRS